MRNSPNDSSMLAAMEAENVHRVFDWLWCSGQLSEGDIAKLPLLAIDAVINLAPPTASNALPGEAESITRQGITYIQIPVAWEKPTLSQLKNFFCVLNTFQGGNVWVHCAKNMRASVFIYLYRRICLAEEEGASSYPLCEVWTPNAIWQAFIRDAFTSQPPLTQCFSNTPNLWLGCFRGH